jgi:hypothetical protein
VSFAPPSLSKKIIDSAFQASNGELGFCLDHANTFLDACERDRIEVMGWELWLTDHKLAVNDEPAPSLGDWCGIIPIAGGAVIGGSGNAHATRRQLAELNIMNEIDRAYISFIRINFTLDV